MNKPRKPKKPTEPLKFKNESPSVLLYSGDYYEIPTFTIAELLDKLWEAYPQIGVLDEDHVYIDIDIDASFDEVDVTVYVKYSEDVNIVDPEYDKKLVRYKNKLKLYPMKLKTYETKMVEYNKSIEEKEEDERQRQIDKARAVLRELGAD